MKSKRPIYFLIIILLLGALSYLYPEFTGNSVSSYYESQDIILSKVIDGDTIKDQNNQTYRLLGINTPEKDMPQSMQAIDFLRQFEGKTITILRDREDTDKYNRKLRYIFYKDRFLNKEILASGLANSYYTKGLIYEKELLSAEKQARLNALGVWQKSSENCAINNCILLEKLNYTAEFFILKNSCSFTCSLTGWFVKDAGRNTFLLTSLDSNQEKTYFSKTEVWNNDGDNFFMFDKNGFLVLYYEY